MYKIFADNTLIYDSTLDEYKIGKGSITLETNRSGSFVFSLYPDHFYYDQFVRLKTVITVYKFGKIVFRGRILNDVTDYWNNKVFTCEGELGFLQDSIIRPFDFSGTPEELFTKLITEHNAQVDEFKRFKIGSVTVVDPNDYIARSNSEYESTLNNLNDRLLEGSLGGYVYITHGDDDTDPIPTINYLAKLTKVATQTVEFGVNLKDYTKTVNVDNVATVIIPLGAKIDDGDSATPDKRLTISSVNDGLDYVYSPEGIALYGRIYKTVIWDDVTDPSILKAKADDMVDSLLVSNTTLQLTAIDLRLIDSTVETFNLNDYIRVVSKPHGFDATLLCNKQTLDLLRPDNDTMTIGYTYPSFVGSTNSDNKSVKKLVNSSIEVVKSDIKKSESTVLTIVDEVKAEIKVSEDTILLQVASKYATSDELKETESKIEVAKESILLSVSQTYTNKTNFENYKSSTESRLSVLSDSIDLKVSQTDFNGLGKRVSEAESSLTLLSNEIKTKVATTDFDKLGNRLSEAESTITQQSNAIDLKVSQTDFDDLGKRVGAAEAGLSLKIGRDDNNQIISMINASANVITLNSNRLIINSDNFSLSADGTVAIRAGTIGNLHIIDGAVNLTQFETEPDANGYITKVNENGVTVYNDETSESVSLGVSGIYTVYIDDAVYGVTVGYDSISVQRDMSKVIITHDSIKIGNTALNESDLQKLLALI